MNNIEHIAEELFNKIRSQFEKITIGDQDGKTTDDPTQARFYNFVYVDADRVKHGQVTISIADEKSLKIIFPKDFYDRFDEIQSQEWEVFLRKMRKFAKRNMLSFDIRDMAKNMLTKRDFQQASRRSDQTPVVESVQWSGTTRTSVQNFGPTRLIVRHTEAVDPERVGARGRKIESMFVETDQGERFRMPYNRLSLGRAMAQHIAHGGRVYDLPGLHIQEMAEEMQNLGMFIRNTRHRQFEDTETQGMVESAIERYRLLKSGLNSMSRTRGYHKFAENFQPESDNHHDYDLDSLKERFVKRVFDDRITAALPYVYKAYHQRQQSENRYIDEFNSWTEQIVENSLDELDTEELKKLMQNPVQAGQDGLDAIAAISGIIDNEDLNDIITQAAQTQGPETDVRNLIDDWLAENYPEYVSLIPLDQPTAQTPISTSDNNQPKVEDIRRLAGLR